MVSLTLIGLIAPSPLSAEPTAAPGPRLLEPEKLPSKRALPKGQDIYSPATSGAQAGVEIPLGTSAQSEAFDPLRQSAAALADGGWAAVWSVGSFPEKDVRMQWLDAAGVPRFATNGLTVAGLMGFFEGSAVVAAHPTAGAFVAYLRGEGGSNFKAFVQSFDGQGQPRWPGDGVQAITSDDSQSNPHLVADRQGGVYICLERVQEEGIWCQHLDSNGQRDWVAAGLLAGNRPGWRVVPRGVLGDDDDLLIFWRNQGEIFKPGVDPMRMEGQRFELDGTKHWGATGLLVRTTGLQEASSHGFDFFDVVTDGAGGAILAFNDWLGTSANLDVVAQRVTAAGALPWAASPDGVAIVAATSARSEHDAALAGPEGGIVVAVDENVSSTSNDLKIYRLDADGEHRWPESGLALSDPASAALDYDATGFYRGGVVHWTWTHQVLPQSSTHDVYLTRFRADGERLDPIEGVAISTAVNSQFNRMTMPSLDGTKFLALWNDNRQGQDVYGALVAVDEIFTDGFESGDAAIWSNASGTE